MIDNDISYLLSAEEQQILTPILRENNLLLKTVRRHLNERRCNHNIQDIVVEAIQE